MKIAMTRPPRRRRLTALAGVLGAAAVLMAMSPSPASSGTGPAVPRPPASPMAVPTGPLFPAALRRSALAGLGRRSGRGPAGRGHRQLVQRHVVEHRLRRSRLRLVQRRWRARDIGYTFQPDGTWQFGYLLTSALYSCQMTVLVFNQGKVTSSDPATHLMELHADRSQMHSEDTCSAAENYDKELGARGRDTHLAAHDRRVRRCADAAPPRYGLLRLPADA